MKYVCLPEERQRRLSFYLAMEEHVARSYSDEPECFFIWQVKPSVIFGRNQVIEREVNIDYCRANGIEMYRRKSGGGCVYADMSNLMFSYITSSDNVALTYNNYINRVVLMLRQIGIEASSTGRNDVVIDGRKVSGNAFYHLPGRSIVHGTMLYDTDMRNMVGSITPSSEKLLSKGVQSVRQHIALLKDHTSMTIDEFKAHARSSMSDGVLQLTDDDVLQIEAIEREYLRPEFIYGKNPDYTLIKHTRVEGVGELEARISLTTRTANGQAQQVIKEVNLLGDFFLVGEIDPLLDALRGCELSREALMARLPADLSGVVRQLKTEDFVELLIK